MLYWIITFFVLALVASVLGFGALAGTSMAIAKFLAYFFIVLFVVSLLYKLLTGRNAKPPL